MKLSKLLQLFIMFTFSTLGFVGFQNCGKQNNGETSINPSLELASGIGTSNLNGTFFQGTMPSSKFSAYFDEIKSLGMDTVVVQSVRTRRCSSDDPFRWSGDTGTKAYIGMFLKVASSKNIKVYIGTHESCWQDSISDQLQREGSDLDFILNKILGAYGNEPSLAGWYLSREPSLAYYQPSQEEMAYYKSLVGVIRKYSNLPILVSPILDDLNGGSVSPKTVATRAKVFYDYTGINIQIWQICINVIQLYASSGHYPVSDYITELRKALPVGKFWAEVETFTQDYKSNFIGKYKTALGMSGPFDKRLTWIQQHFFGTLDPLVHSEAKTMLAEFKAHYGISGRVITPSTISYGTAPQSGATDPRILINGIVGDFANPNSANFSVFSGNTQIKVDLGSSQKVDWISLHSLKNIPLGFNPPTQMTIHSSQDGTNFTLVGSWNIYATKSTDVVVSNSQPMGITAKVFRITLNGSSKFALSEMSLVSEGSGTTSPGITLNDGGISVYNNQPAAWASSPNLPTSFKVRIFKGTTLLGEAIPTVSADRTWFSFILPSASCTVYPTSCAADVEIYNSTSGLKSNRISIRSQ